MEECEVSPASSDPSWKPASERRMAWAQSRDSWQASVSEDQGTEGQLPAPIADGKSNPATEPGRIPVKIEKWLKDCRTPLGASLDEQSTSPSKGPPRNGCSFEDDLSLGAEANHLQSSSAKPDNPGYGMPAREKRSQFRQKGRSMNSTGSGKSSATVSSVSELLDLYEEDPEEILYNLGFGREEPDIASKIPSRFFNSSSGAKGIDIKVYLGAQMQRMELENPNFALTSRFRQTEVLATVANVFSEIYSHVSGHPLQKIGSRDGDLKKNSSALNAVKILKRNLTRPNLHVAAEGTLTPSTMESNPDKGEGRSQGSVQSPPPDPEAKPQPKVFKKKDSSSLATVAEETNHGSTGGPQQGGSRRASEENPPLSNGEQPSLSTSEQNPLLSNGERLSPSASEQNPLLGDGERLSPSASEEGAAVAPDAPDGPILVSVSEAPVMTVVPEQGAGEREALQHRAVFPLACSLLPIQLSQPRDSFEMEELQSTEDEVPGVGCLSRVGHEYLLRTASQQSDSSGFAEEPSTDVAANYLKVQESTDSCDSETTLTSHAGGLTSPLVLDHPAYEKLQGEPLSQPSTSHLGLARVQEEAPQQVDQVVPASVAEEGRGAPADPAAPAPPAGVSVDFADELGSATETNPSSPSSSSTALGAAVEGDDSLERDLSPERGSDPGIESRVVGEEVLSTTERVRSALLRAQQRVTVACEERTGRVWVRARDLLESRERHPLQRTSSLPTSWISPTRVVSSVHIQLGQGVVKHHLPSYSYRYKEEEDSVAKEDEDEPQARCRSTLLINPVLPDGNAFAPPLETQTDSSGAPPYPLNVPQHLTQSANSLYSAPADFPRRHLAEAPLWSTSSVPDLRPHPLLPQHAHHHHHLSHCYGETASSANHKAVNTPHYSHSPGTVNNPYNHTHGAPYTQYAQWQKTQFSDPLHTHPQGLPFSQTHLSYTQQVGGPYSSPDSPHSVPPSSPYGFNMQANLYHPQVPVSHSHTAPYSLPYRSAPYHPAMTPGHQYNAPFSPASATSAPASSLFPYDSPTPPPVIGSTEMQLRRVLHEIRNTVKSLGQNATMPRGSLRSGPQSPQQPPTPLYEELQVRRQSLNVFRTQMMDLELMLMRQQAMVYQHLSPDERREAEQLQRLRTAVRQELQELELQLEDRLLTLEDQLRSAQHSRLCRHPLSMSRGHSIDSLSSLSALRAMEPVCDLLREQLSLQSELGYDASLSAVGTPTSGRSSRAASPTRGTQPPTCCSPSLQRRSLYRSSVSLTPAVPPRSGAGIHPPTASQEPTLGRDMPQEPREEAHQQEQRAGGVGGAGNTTLHQLVAEIKQNLAEEIRQEIMNELLAAVAPRRTPVATREPPV